jgi:hypothetical protein
MRLAMPLVMMTLLPPMNGRRRRWPVAGAVLLVVAFGSLPRHAAAGDAEVAANVAAALRLVQARSLKCTWDQGAYARWDSEPTWTTRLLMLVGVRASGSASEAAAPVVRLTRWGDDNVTHFDAIDVRAGTARIIGNNGAGALLASAGPGGLMFLEQTDAGGVNVTSVFPFPRRAHAGADEYRAVTSRHLATLLGDPLVSQYYGTCTVLATDG